MGGWVGEDGWKDERIGGCVGGQEDGWEDWRMGSGRMDGCSTLSIDFL